MLARIFPPGNSNMIRLRLCLVTSLVAIAFIWPTAAAAQIASATAQAEAQILYHQRHRSLDRHRVAFGQCHLRRRIDLRRHAVGRQL
jgi:hypothetical protein